jgi:signal transduction histidine kinase
MLSGTFLSIEFFKWYVGVDSVSANLGSIQFKIIYVLLLISSILVAFLKPKQDYLEKTEETIDDLDHKVSHLYKRITYYSERVIDQQKEIEQLGETAQKILNNVNHELRLPVGNVINFASLLNEGLEKYTKPQLKKLTDEVYKNSNRLSSMILNMLDLATLNANKLELEKKLVNISELVENRVQNCRLIYLENKKIDFDLSIQQNILIKIDPNYIRQVVDNLVINAIMFSNEGVVKITVHQIGNNMQFIIADQGQGIAKEELHDIFIPFKMSTKTESKAKGRGVGLALCKSAVEAHNGTVQAISNTKGTTFIVQLPLNT